MGDILFLAHRLPYPPDRGDRIRSWHILQALAKLAPVHVVAPIDSAADRQHVALVETVATSVTTAVRPASKGLAVMRSLASGRPASVELFAVPRLIAAARNLLATKDISAVYAFSGQMAHYVPPLDGVRFVMDFVDMDSAKFKAQAKAAHGIVKLLLTREAKRLLAFEVETAQRADVALFVSQTEAALFARNTGLPAQALENGIDVDCFSPNRVAAIDAPPPLIVFTGQMDYAPNAEAVTAFVRDVLPHIPNAHFAIVGRSPTAAVRALAGARVTVTGEVSDVRPWLAAADLVVAPLLLARGVQNKILEAMAMGKAVVASRAAAQGIDAVDGRDLIVSDDPATAINALLDNPERLRAIGEAARAQMVARYGWDRQMAPLAGYLGL